MNTDLTTECRLEYLCPDGTWALLGVHPLLHPDRYARRLCDAGKVARAVEVAAPNRVWTSDNVPADPSVLIPVTEGGPVPYRLPRPDDASCPHCEGAHALPHDGSCII